jgi:phosphoribosylamine-glycine ligase
MKKPTFLFYNVGKDFLGIQMRVQAEGFRTIAYYDQSGIEGHNKHGKGIVDCIDDPFEIIDEFKTHPDDLIILIDDNSKGEMCDVLRHFGFKVIGSSGLADRYEYERDEGSELAEKIGMSLPKSHEFTDFTQAHRFLLSQDPGKKFVFKGNGFDLAGGAKTYVAKNISDLEKFLTWVEQDQSVHGYTVEKFILQEVVNGIEVDIASWYNGEEFSKISTVCFEQKRVDGLGAAQGSTGQVICMMPMSETYSAYFAKLEPMVKGSGPNEWAINALVDHSLKEPHFLEWTPRFGWDSTFGELALLADAGVSLAQFLMRLAYGKPIPVTMLPIGRYSAAVRLFSESTGTPAKDVCGKPLWIDPSIAQHIWLYAAEKCEEDNCYTITDATFAVATACGDSPEEAVAKVYAMIDPSAGLLTTPDLLYSKDIGKGIGDNIRTLQEYGILGDY